MTDHAGEHPIRLSIYSTPTHLAVVRGAVDGLCRSIGFDEQCITHVVMSVDEALTNVIRHAYGHGETEPIEIELDWTDPPAGVRICIRDRGRGAGPDEMDQGETNTLEPGGLGLHIMSRCMDSLEYVPAEGGGTVLTMTKRLQRERRRT